MGDQIVCPLEVDNIDGQYHYVRDKSVNALNAVNRFIIMFASIALSFSFAFTNTSITSIQNATPNNQIQINNFSFYTIELAFASTCLLIFPIFGYLILKYREYKGKSEALLIKMIAFRYYNSHVKCPKQVDSDSLKNCYRFIRDNLYPLTCHITYLTGINQDRVLDLLCEARDEFPCNLDKK